MNHVDNRVLEVVISPLSGTLFMQQCARCLGLVASHDRLVCRGVVCQDAMKMVSTVHTFIIAIYRQL